MGNPFDSVELKCAAAIGGAAIGNLPLALSGAKSCEKVLEKVIPPSPQPPPSQYKPAHPGFCQGGGSSFPFFNPFLNPMDLYQAAKDNPASLLGLMPLIGSPVTLGLMTFALPPCQPTSPQKLGEKLGKELFEAAMGAVMVGGAARAIRAVAKPAPQEKPIEKDDTPLLLVSPTLWLADKIFN